MPGFTLKKKDFFKNAPAIAVFAVGGTFVSTLVFGLLTYFLVIIHVVSRSALGPAPLTECMLYGAHPRSCLCPQPGCSAVDIRVFNRRFCPRSCLAC